MHRQRSASAAIQRKGMDTADLVDSVLTGGKKVALVGENHSETLHKEEETYFGRHAVGYHTENSALTQSYGEAATGELSVMHDASAFAVENVPLRALSEVFDLEKDHDEFCKNYVVPVTHFWADGSKLVERMDKLVNPRMLARLARELHLLKHAFHSTGFARLKEESALYLGPLHNLMSEMDATVAALAGTNWQGEGAALAKEFDAAVLLFYLHDVQIEHLMDTLETSEDFERFHTAVEWLEKYCEQMKELLPRLRIFLLKIISKQTPGEAAVPNAGTDSDTAITKGRSEAMLNSAAWLSRNTARREIVKVGESHIDDIDGVEIDADALDIIHKDDYYRMQDATGTQSLRKA